MDDEQPGDERVAPGVGQTKAGLGEERAQAPPGGAGELAGMRRNADRGDERRGECEARGIEREGRPGADERDGPAGDGGGNDLDQPPGGPGHRVCGEPLPHGGQGGDHRALRRVEEDVADRETGGHGVGVPDALRPDKGERERRAEQVRPDQDRLTAGPVDEHSGDRREKQDREDLDRDQAGDGKPLARERKDEDDQRDVMERVAEARK